MKLTKELQRYNSLFIDTAPFIYFIEKHPKFGSVAKEVVDVFQSDKLQAFSSVVTLTEVLAKPYQVGNETLAKKFSEFLIYGKHLSLLEISTSIAERAARLRGQYFWLRTVDALQISASLYVNANVFITNDKPLKQVKEINVIVLEDYL
ncbi:MAG: PIN domain-containing protein [Ignavibacteriales bacterium]|nr:PIN domain-containing protein [Ignavibacteriales bacterium]